MSPQIIVLAFVLSSIKLMFFFCCPVKINHLFLQGNSCININGLFPSDIVHSTFPIQCQENVVVVDLGTNQGTLKTNLALRASFVILFLGNCHKYQSFHCRWS